MRRYFLASRRWRYNSAHHKHAELGPMSPKAIPSIRLALLLKAINGLAGPFTGTYWLVLN